MISLVFDIEEFNSARARKRETSKRALKHMHVQEGIPFAAASKSSKSRAFSCANSTQETPLLDARASELAPARNNNSAHSDCCQ